MGVDMIGPPAFLAKLVAEYCGKHLSCQLWEQHVSGIVGAVAGPEEINLILRKSILKLSQIQQEYFILADFLKEFLWLFSELTWIIPPQKWV